MSDESSCATCCPWGIHFSTFTRWVGLLNGGLIALSDTGNATTHRTRWSLSLVRRSDGTNVCVVGLVLSFIGFYSRLKQLSPTHCNPDHHEPYIHTRLYAERSPTCAGLSPNLTSNILFLLLWVILSHKETNVELEQGTEHFFLYCSSSKLKGFYWGTHFFFNCCKIHHVQILTFIYLSSSIP